MGTLLKSILIDPGKLGVFFYYYNGIFLKSIYSTLECQYSTEAGVHNLRLHWNGSNLYSVYISMSFFLRFHYNDYTTLIHPPSLLGNLNIPYLQCSIIK